MTLQLEIFVQNQFQLWIIDTNGQPSNQWAIHKDTDHNSNLLPVKVRVPNHSSELDIRDVELFYNDFSTVLSVAHQVEREIRAADDLGRPWQLDKVNDYFWQLIEEEEQHDR